MTDKITQQKAVSKLCVIADKMVHQVGVCEKTLTDKERSNREWGRVVAHARHLQRSTEECLKTGAAGEP